MKALPRKIAQGLVLLILFCGTPHALAEIQVTITSITQDSADAASPYNFTVNFSALETSRTNRSVSSAKLLVNDNVVGECATGSGGANGNMKNSNAKTGSYEVDNATNGGNSAGFNYSGLAVGSYTIKLTIFDGNNCSGANGTSAGFAFTVTDDNDAPVVSDAGATLAYTEGDSATVIDGTLTITDVDDTNMEGATITISSGYESSEDVLAFTNANGITGSWNSGTGVLTLSGSASKANYETAFESITYQNTNTDDPDNTNRTITWVVSDGTANSSGVTSTITIADANDAPVVSDAGATLAYTEGDSATVIDGTLTITDVDDTNMEGATITISSGYESSEDVLAFTNANGITGSWNSGTGVLTLSGSASKANYETAFESITYQNTNTDDPDNTNRTITWVVSDGTANSSGVTSTITIADANDAPVVSDAGATLAYTEGDSATVIDGTLTITDVDDTNMEGATITISSGYESSEDVLAFTNANGITGSWNSGTGVLTLSGSASKANYETAFESITYQNTNTDDPDNTNRTITWVVSDGTANSSGVTSTITIADANDAPVVSDAGATLAYTEGDSATVIDGTLTITDVDDTNMEGATITISSGYESSEDVLAFTNANGITGSWNSGTGVLTLSGSASKANYETAFESITYQNTNTDDPDNTNRTITWVVSDGTANSSGVTSTITVADVNDAPVVSDAGGTLSFSAGGSATVIDGTLTITDVDDTNMESATITISSGYEPSEDVLAFTNANGITGSWNSGTGVLTLSGSASKANYETAFESVTYQNTDTGSPDTSDRIVTWLVSDGDTNSAAGVTSTISVSAPSLHHYAVSYDGGSTTNDANGPNCVATPVTITAHNAGHSAVTTSNTVTLTTSSGNGAWVSNADNASISIGFGGANAITTYLRHPTAGATTINVTDGSNSESEDPTYTFNAASMSLEFFLDANANGAPDGSGDDLTTLTAGTTFNQVLVGVVDGGSVCTQDSTIAGQTIATNLAYECVNPSTCQRDKDLTVTPTGGSATGIEDNNSGASLAYQAVNLVFNGSGYAPIPLVYKDVGRVRLYGALTVPASGNNPALTVTGSSNEFISKPADLVVSVASNPATTASGSGFITASTNFNVGVQARNSLGGTTPNFGQESSAETAKVALVALTYPTGGSNAGTLTSGSYSLSGSTDGAGTVVASFNEVGTITLRAEIGDGDYLGVGNVTGTTSGNIGRFYPNQFVLSSDGVIDACTPGTDFTYMDAPNLAIAYTITAKNAAGATVTHYDTSDGYAVASIAAVAEATTNNGTNLSSRLTHATTSWNAGIYTINDTTAKFARGSNPEAELDLDIGLTLTDSLDGRNFSSLDMNAGTSGNCASDSSCNSLDLTGNPKLRWGRLALNSASGSETQALGVPLLTQYYNGSSFITNTDDGCTTIARSKIEFNDGAINTAANLTIDIGSGSNNSTGSSSNVNLSSADLVVVSGDGNLSFSAPSDGDRGSFTVAIDLTNLPWLKYDWDLDGSHDDSPPGVTGTFGIYGGHSKILFRRESN